MASTLTTQIKFGPESPPTPSPSPDTNKARKSLAGDALGSPASTSSTLARLEIFREAVEIPGCSPSTFVYPHSSPAIDTPYHDRFREVVNIFRYNTLEHPKLRENARLIDYTLRLCGTSPEESHPAILVFCRQNEFKYLRPLLTSRELKFQYALRKPSKKFPWSKSETLPADDNHRTSFNLYFWRERIPRTLLWGGSGNVILQFQPLGIASELSLCGSMIRHESDGLEDIRCSTLGCVIQIGSEWYATTTKHTLIRGDERETHELIGYSYTSRPFETELGEIEITNQNEEDGYVLDDVEYDIMSESDDDDDQHVEQLLPFCLELNEPLERKKGDPQPAKHSYVFPTGFEQRELDEIDYDWAIIKLKDPLNWRPNGFALNARAPNPALQFISAVASSLPRDQTPVLIITQAASPQEGFLQPGTSFLGGITGNRPSEVHTVIPSKRNCITKGDSGALVVDASTKAIYGHVVGSNPLGEVYICSLQRILEQIQHRFPDSIVTLPDPTKTLKELLMRRKRDDNTATSQSSFNSTRQSQAVTGRDWQDAGDLNDMTEDYRELQMLRSLVRKQQNELHEKDQEAYRERRRLLERNRNLMTEVMTLRETLSQAQGMKWTTRQDVLDLVECDVHESMTPPLSPPDP